MVFPCFRYVYIKATLEEWLTSKHPNGSGLSVLAVARKTEAPKLFHGKEFLDLGRVQPLCVRQMFLEIA